MLIVNTIKRQGADDLEAPDPCRSCGSLDDIYVVEYPDTRRDRGTVPGFHPRREPVCRACRDLLTKVHVQHRTKEYLWRSRN